MRQRFYLIALSVFLFVHFHANAQVISTIAGNGGTGYGGDFGAATAASIGDPRGIATDSAGNIYVTTNNNNVRKISVSGIITTVAGSASAGSGFSGDGGAATLARLSAPQGLCVDRAGNIYIADEGNYRVRKVNTSGIISTVAGNGSGGYSADGAAATATGLSAFDVVIDTFGNLYIADGNNHRIRKVNTSGIISTVAGNGTGYYYPSDDGGQATAAAIYGPTGIDLDAAGNMYIVENQSYVVRKVNTSGIITTVAGNAYDVLSMGTGDYTGDGGPATAANMWAPFGVSVDGTGNMYIADQTNSVVRFVNSNTGIISTFAGYYTYGYSGDGGAATAAAMNQPVDVAYDRNRNLFIADQVNRVIRKVPPVITIATTSDTVCARASVTYSSAITVSGTVHYHWKTNSNYTGSDANTFTADSVHTGDTISCLLTGSATTDTIATSNTIVMFAKPLPVVSAITGANSVCVSANTTLADASTGGTWSSSNTSFATVSSSGLVHGSAAGTTVISYTITNTCGSVSDTQAVTVNTATTPAAITGASAVCVGDTTTIFDSPTGGTWSSSNTSLATISASGKVTGVSAGSLTITYTLTSACGSAFATKVFTVNPAPNAGSISGTTTLCPGNTATLSNAIAGGTWSSSATSTVSVNSTGLITGVAAGTATISYSVSNGCGTDYATTTILVNPNPSAGTISGTSSICPAAITNLTSTATGGTWSSSNSAIATVSAVGSVTGVASGSANISYSVSNSCGTANAVQSVTVLSAPLSGTISGASSFCNSTSTTFTASVAGGSWSSSNTSIATISSTGVATAVSVGTFVITCTWTNSCGSVFATTNVTTLSVPSVAAISGARSVCALANTTLSDATSGGTWSSSDTTSAIVSSSGTVTGRASGNVIITYNITNTCGSAMDTQLVAILPLPLAGTISDPGTVCVGSTTLMSASVFGGTWLASNPGVATITSAGSLQPLISGTSIVSYIVSNSCGADTARFSLTVTPLVSALVSGARAVCVATSTGLSAATAGGSWSSSAASVATVNSSGVVTGVLGGTALITYSVTNACNTAQDTFLISISPAPTAGTISGPAIVCGGTLANYTNSVSPAGTWSVTNTAIATINASGNVRALHPGNDTVLYSVANSCGTSVARLPIFIDSITLGVNAVIQPTLCNNGSFTLNGLQPSSSYQFFYQKGGVPDSLAILSDASGNYLFSGLYPSNYTYLYTRSTSGCVSTPIAPTLSPVALTDSTHLVIVDTANPSYCGATDGHITIGGMTPGMDYSIYVRKRGAYTSDTITANASGQYIIGSLSAGQYQYIYVAIGHHHLAGYDSCISNVLADPPITLVDPTMPAITGGSALCAGSNLTLSNAMASGTWSSSNTSIATISSSGGLHGVAAGSATITYSVSGTCLATLPISVNAIPVAGTITGTTSVCAGSSSTLANATGTTGGTWSSSNTGVATVSASGVVTGIAAGTATISYTANTASCGSATATTAFTVNALPVAGTITGTFTACAGNTSSLTNPTGTTGGTWSSSNTAVATVNSSGAVAAIAAGTTTISYTAVTASCGSATTSTSFTVNALPVAGTITGTTSVCAGSSSTLANATGTTGGTWSSSNTSVATVNALGVVTGIAAGTATISYTANTASCGSATATTAFTVNAVPVAGTITGTLAACAANTSSLTNPTGTTGGTWSSSNTTVATINSSGVVAAIAAGSTTISYTAVTPTCGSATTSASFTVNALPVAGTITGTTSVCAGSSSTLANATGTSGGTWSSNNTSVATVNASGIVMGIAAGTATISYTANTASCGSATATTAFTVNALPVAGTITGTLAACAGNTSSLTNPTGTIGGTWSSSNTAVATINSSGAAAAIAAGSTTISYTVVTPTCGSATTSASFTVNAIPVAGTITGTTSVCAGSSSTLANATGTTGGTWSSSNASVATVNSSGGVTGISAGTATISYTANTASCGSATATTAFTVNALPVAGTITGTLAACAGNTSTLTNPTATTGGTWSSSNTTVATVNSSGAVAAIAAGTTTISYTAVTASCGSSTTSTSFTVNALPVAGTITGTTNVCAGSSSTLANATGTTGGTWSSSNTSVATVNASGVVTGIAAGTATISYTANTASCGSATATTAFTVNALPVAGTITGTLAACAGNTSSLTNPTGTTGGTWSSSNTTVATINSSGVVAAIAAGSTTISYTAVTPTCGSATTSASFIVNALPVAGTITGITSVCAGSSSTLANATGTTGGTWSSSNTSVATVNASGVVTGIAAGTATISYTANTASCGSATATTAFTVNALPVAGTITGTLAACTGNTSSLTNPTGTIGGTWSSSNTTVATINSSGVVAAIAAGSTTISYTAVTPTCGSATTSTSFTVNALPVAGTITGTTSVCAGSSSTLANATGTTGSTWSSSNTGVATVSASGIVTGVAAGTATISYTANTASCGSATATTAFTVNALPVAGTLSGSSSVCVGSSTTLNPTVSGGTWSSSAPTVASVNSTGVVSGIGTGTATITYTVSNGCGTAFTTRSIIVNALPVAAIISGTASVCVSSLVTLTASITGGTWSSGNTGIATVNNSGRVTGVSGGTATISYAITNSCGTAYATQSFIVTTTPTGVGAIVVPGPACVGATISLTDTTAGGTWSSGTTSIATINATGQVTGISTGTAIISYGVSNTCGITYVTTSISVGGLPSVSTVVGASSICVGTSTTYTDATAGGAWSSGDPSIATVIASGTGAGTVTGLSTGTILISYGVSNACGTAYGVKALTVLDIPLTPPAIGGSASVCVGDSTRQTNTVSSGTWTSLRPTVATVSTTGYVTGVAGGTDTIVYTVTNTCGSASVSKMITINTLRSVGPITGADSVCVGTTATLGDTAAGGAWSCPTTSIATISATGVVAGLSTGNASIVYRLTNVCGSVTTSRNLYVNPQPNAGIISGPRSVCASDSISLRSTVATGTWLSSNLSIATVSNAGIVTGIAAGTATISYSVTNSCNTAVDTYSVHVNPLPVLGSITGPTRVCVGTTTSLSASVAGGSWASASTATAAVNAAGVVTGLVSGVSIISYTTTNSCGSVTDTQSLTIDPLPDSGIITSGRFVCVGGSLAMTETATGGTWSSSNTATASISASGVLGTLAAGTTIVNYSVTNRCGTAVDTQFVLVESPADAGIISGADSVCNEATTTLTASATGGTWSSTAPGIASVSAGVVRALSPGTSTISYAVTNSCGTAAATHPLHVLPLPSAGSISGASSLCVDAALTLSATGVGGTWSVAPGSVASIDAVGVLSGVSAGSATVTYSVTNSCGTDIATYNITVLPLPVAGTIAGVDSLCPGVSSALSASVSGGSWSSSDPSLATVTATGNVRAIAAGTVFITYSVSNSCGTADSIHRILINPSPVAGAISGPAAICAATTSSFTASVVGGIWSSSDTGIALIDAAGVVRGNTGGVATISYSVTNSCGTASAVQSVRVNPLPSAGTLSGPTHVCVGANIAISVSGASGTGSWSVGSTAIATVSTFGVVTGISAGSTIITFTASNSCGTSSTTYNIVVDPLANAGSISGASTVCVSSAITLTDVAAGGIWTSSNASVATVSPTGFVTGNSFGTATISYTVTNGCGSVTATRDISILALPRAGTITGLSTMCIRTSSTFSETLPGGIWSATNGRAAVISTGLVTAITPGTDTIVYTITNSCGTATTNWPVSIITTITPGTISGATTVCESATATLTYSGSGGSWRATNSNATISAGGVVTGISAGTDTVLYSLTNTCGTTSARFMMTVNPLPDPGTITGVHEICNGSSFAFSESVGGGTWLSADASLATVSSTGLVTTLNAGSALISYRVTNGCGTRDAIYGFIIRNPVSAGTLSGASRVCIGSPVTLASTSAGGQWLCSDSLVATVNSTGLVTGNTTGSVTIKYWLENICGADTSSLSLPVYAAPDAGTIIGDHRVCVGQSDTLRSTVTSGRWSSSAPGTLSIDSLSGIFRGVAAGSAIVTYSYTNVCGTAVAADTIVANPLPDLSSTLVPAPVCSGDTFRYIPASSSVGATFGWSRNAVSGLANAAATGSGNITESLNDTSTLAVTTAYTYTITSTQGCQSTENISVTIKPVARLTSLPTSSICSGTRLNYSGIANIAGTTLSWTRAATLGVSPSTGAGDNEINETLVNNTTTQQQMTYVFHLSYDGCTDTQQLHVMVAAAGPQAKITTMSPAVVCSGTQYQNFGTNAIAGVNYAWTSSGATIWAIGTGAQYCLVNFDRPGMAQIYLFATFDGQTCPGRDSFTVSVSDNESEKPAVHYLEGVFSVDGTYATYQWGYDDANTLDSTLLRGETNQSYINDNPDANKYYWVITQRLWCIQKSYLNAPLTVRTQNNAIAAAIGVFPNPNKGSFFVTTQTQVTEQAHLIITNLVGTTLMDIPCYTNQKMDIRLEQAPGIYLVSLITASGRSVAKVTITE